ncbi:hypothetical protein [Actinomyces naeslundii]|uniref:hypothetical protein n=1 Tax=Actinomyces naeslundii TaxID=1655 RepID=UPI00094C9450|nr:hypothetical protein [Actinomyces naeslundii]OLO88669.1 hypothetical protein BKH11_00645 [Actinomyces naeslundii]OLO93027.1 hypothetical protein BKH09_03100 [Actinomyces naeslundii]OMG07693.1 hypothetical protein BKH08_12360 [Actinomyces naeslundii]
MRSTVKVLSAVAALAMAAGLSACDEQDIAQPSPDGASASSSAEADSDASDTPPSEDSKDDKDSTNKDGETTKSGSKIQNIKPVTFKDEQISLTQTCDKVIEDYAAPKYKQTHSEETVYLLHCTLDFSGDIGYSTTLSDSTSLQDKSNSSLKADEYGALLTDDLKDDGLEVIDYKDFGSEKVEGWFALSSVTKSSTLKPFSEGTTSIVYDREDAKSSQTGKEYPAYSDTQDLVLK